MGILFNHDDEDEEAVEEEPEDSDEEEQTLVKVEITRQRHASHTVHLAEAEFTDGETEAFMFDAMKRKDGAIVLYNYTSFSSRRRGKEAFVTIPPHNLKTFKTVRREEVSIPTHLHTSSLGLFTAEKAEEKREFYEDDDDVTDISLYEK